MWVPEIVSSCVVVPSVCMNVNGMELLVLEVLDMLMLLVDESDIRVKKSYYYYWRTELVLEY